MYYDSPHFTVKETEVQRSIDLLKVTRLVNVRAGIGTGCLVPWSFLDPEAKGLLRGQDLRG